MIRLSLLCALLALYLLPSCAEPAHRSAPMIPLVTTLPVKGIVTVVGEAGRFYLNIGSEEQVNPGAELLLLHEGNVVGRAKVIEVGWLDALAAVKPGTSPAVVRTGDTVLVEFNPPRHGTAHTSPLLTTIKNEHWREPFYAALFLYAFFRGTR